MSDPSSDVNPLDALAEEFTARHRAGERPSLGRVHRRQTDLADDIRDLFPGLVLMEGGSGPIAATATGPFTPAWRRCCSGWATSASCARSAAAAWEWSMRRSRSRWGGTSR